MFTIKTLAIQRISIIDSQFFTVSSGIQMRGVVHDTFTMKLCIIINFEIRELLWLITQFATIITQRIPIVEQELPTLPEYLGSPPVFSGVAVSRSLALCVCFVDRCLSFSFGHCVVCSSILITPLVSSSSSYSWPVAKLELYSNFFKAYK